MSETLEKKVVAEKEKSIQKKYTPEEARKMMLELAVPLGELRNNLKDFGDNILPQLLHGSEKERKQASEKFTEKAADVLRALETESHVAIMESFDQDYRGLAKELTLELIKDYNCISSAEKVLAEVIANAFIRIIDNSRRLNNNFGGPGSPITETKTKFLSLLSIQIDRANRQFLNALVTLKQIKSPTIEMNIKANNAFVAQNQQINSGDQPRSSNNETNEAK